MNDETEQGNLSLFKKGVEELVRECNDFELLELVYLMLANA